MTRLIALAAAALLLASAVLLLGGCAVIPASWLGVPVREEPVAAAPRREPAPVVVCPGPVLVPTAPKAPRSVEAIAAYATRLDEALVRSERARAACSSAVDQLRNAAAPE